MLIRPPVVRSMRRDLWAQMTGTQNTGPAATAAGEPARSETAVRLEQLRTLAELRDTGVIDDEEFALLKAKLLA